MVKKCDSILNDSDFNVISHLCKKEEEVIKMNKRLGENSAPKGIRG